MSANTQVSMGVREFTELARTYPLSGEQRKTIVEQALLLLEQNYVHLPVKRVLHAVDPVRRLRLYKQALEESNSAWSDAEFHREMTTIFSSLRDLHTRYILPPPYRGRVAILPFSVEAVYDEAPQDGDAVTPGVEPKYIISHVDGSSVPSDLEPGQEVLTWNGAPIDRAVAANSERYPGVSPADRHARGLLSLTARSLDHGPPPDEEWVHVGIAGKEQEVRVPWEVRSLEDWVQSRPWEESLTLAVDLEQRAVGRARMGSFVPEVAAQDQARDQGTPAQQPEGPLESTWPSVFQARKVVLESGAVYGYLRIRTFDVPAADSFIRECIRLLKELPQEGLIIDIRGNPGGHVPSAEGLLQLFAPGPIEPETAHFISSRLNLQVCSGIKAKLHRLSPWVDSMKQAQRTGATYSAGFPITTKHKANVYGQVYFGPVVLIIDALCYSAADIFAAGFQDHGLGDILGVDGNTGAGGANVWRHEHLRQALPEEEAYFELPGGVDVTVAMRRMLRVKQYAEAPIEDFGVRANKRHFMTREDALNQNVHLIEKACQLLQAAEPARWLEVTVEPKSEGLAVKVDTKRLDRIDVYLADRPQITSDVKMDADSVTFELPMANLPMLAIEVRGFAGRKHAATRKVYVPNPEFRLDEVAVKPLVATASP